MNDDVTVVVACFNYGAYVGEAVASALAQAGGPPRVLVVDDGSTDPATHAALDALPAAVELLRQDNRGVCAARNAGLARVTTPYALLLDADDRLAPGALQAMRAPLEREPSLGFAYGTVRFFGAWEGELRMPPYDPFKLLYRHTIGLTALMRTQVARDTGGFDEAFDCYEDWELWLNALAHGWRGRQVDAVTLEYRRHDDGSKQAQDRTAYRATYRRLRAKHAQLYARDAELARAAGDGALTRALYRRFWGPRPIPAALEAALHRLLWKA
ncbi:MAG TPA: glycosyltransferase family A protein [Conexibacter sp.]